MLELLDKFLADWPLLIFFFFFSVLIIITHPDTEDLVCKMFWRHK